MKGKHMFGLPPSFWSRVNFRGPRMRPGIGHCWPFTAGTFGGGYGMFQVGKKTVSAHRLVLAGKLRRQLAPGMQALHKCDNPGCVCPFHLWEGTHRQNMADKVAKGRQGLLLGEAHPLHKLTDEQVREIRAAPVGVTNVELAARFGVKPPVISLIRRHKARRHVR